ncbi:hypothetical protein N7465_002517 [Penicillium sp. CMV-2018d]|nr:hypothetical protein N7465_002517 [Penicillium sp. CMV-2018d]
MFVTQDSEGRKRQRISTACLGCREKKTKCDGNPLRCSQCQYRDQQCIYTHGESKRKPPSKNYVKALEARLESLEKELAAIHAVDISRHPDSSHFEDNEVLPDSLALQSAPTPLDELTNTLGRFHIADGGDVRYFGSRSNFHLLQTAFFNHKSSKQMQKEGYDEVLLAMGPLKLSQDLHNHLLDLFWRWQNVWQYFVPRKLFIESMAAAGGAPFGRFHSPLLLCAIYALASRYSDRPEVRTDPQNPDTAGNEFMARAKFMLPHESEAATTQTVQAVVILSLCESARDKETLAYITSGMAMRMALNLGLHVDCSPCIGNGSLTADEAEDRAVTWWGVYLLDKLFNVGLGRPSMIQERDVSARMPSLDSDDEVAPWGNESDTDGGAPMLSHCVSLAIATREMLSIVAEVLDAIYSPSAPTMRSPKETIVTQAYVRLVSFHNSLPSHLRISQTSDSPTTAHVYHLHLQYHALLILLHRPFLKASGQASTNSQIQEFDDDDLHSTVCRASAESICRITRCYHKMYNLRTIPVSAVHCVFTAAIVFMVDATSTSNLVKGKAYRELKWCVKALEELETAWSWSTRHLVAMVNVAHAWAIDLPIFRKPRYQKVTRRRMRHIQGARKNEACATEDDGLNTMGIISAPGFDNEINTNFFQDTTGVSDDGSLDWSLDRILFGADWTLPFE